MSKLSPGPWNAVHSTWGENICGGGPIGAMWDIYDANDVLVARITSRMMENTTPTDEANAHLLAAARDLLAALEGVEWVDLPTENWDDDRRYRGCPECEAYYEDGHDPDCQLRAAIARAKGESDD